MRRFLSNIFGFFVPLACLAGMLVSQAGISIDSKVDRSTITIGDLVEYSVEVTRSPGLEIVMPELGENLGAFELRDYSVHDPIEKNATVIERVDYIISTFDVGEFEIPPLTFYYLVPGDSTRHELKTQKLSILVESMKPSEAGDIRDIKQPAELPKDYRKYIIAGSIAFAFLLLTLISIYIWRRRKAGKGILPQKVEPPRPAHETAIEALDKLKRSSLISEGKVKEYYIELSEIIRTYIEGRYFIVALEMTTSDLIQELRKADVENENVEIIQDFLSLCDLVKFAKHHPQNEQHDETLTQAYALVEKTKFLYEIPLSSEAEPRSVEDETPSKIAEVQQV